MVDPNAPIGLRGPQVAELLNMSTPTWDRLWRSEQAPQPTRFTSRLVVWSADEIRAWMANGAPPLEDWRRIWNRMLDRGTWSGGNPELKRGA